MAVDLDIHSLKLSFAFRKGIDSVEDTDSAVGALFCEPESAKYTFFFPMKYPFKCFAGRHDLVRFDNNNLIMIIMIDNKTILVFTSTTNKTYGSSRVESPPLCDKLRCVYLQLN